MKSSKTLNNMIEYALFISAIKTFKAMPRSISKIIIIGLFDLIGYRIGVRRKLALQQLTDVFPTLTKSAKHKIIRNVYRNMALNVISVYMTNDKDLHRISHFENKEYVAEALSRKNGVLLVTGHFGDWEAPCRVLPLEGYGLAMITKKQRNRKFDAYTNAIREHTGGTVIFMKNALRGILEHTSHNDLIGILIDQDAGRRGILTDFMGKPASNWKGTAKIALKYKIPIVPAFVIRNKDDTLRFRFEKMLDPESLNDTPENMILLIQEMNRALEEKIREYPDQWFWLHKRWKGAKFFHKDS